MQNTMLHIRPATLPDSGFSETSDGVSSDSQFRFDELTVCQYPVEANSPTCSVVSDCAASFSRRLLSWHVDGSSILQKRRARSDPGLRRHHHRTDISHTTIGTQTDHIHNATLDRPYVVHRHLHLVNRFADDLPSFLDSPERQSHVILSIGRRLREMGDEFNRNRTQNDDFDQQDHSIRQIDPPSISQFARWITIGLEYATMLQR